MKRLRRIVVVGVSVLALASAAIACDLSGTVTETVTEAELNASLAGDGVTADLRPDVVVFTTDIDGQAAEMYVEFAAVDGQIAATLTKVTVNGEEFDLALFAGANESFAAAINGEIDYYVDSISITDDEMTVTGHRE